MKKTKLVIEAWPQLIDALNRHPMLGTDPADIARFLIIESLSQRDRERNSARQARAAAIASGYRGDL